MTKFFSHLHKPKAVSSCFFCIFASILVTCNLIFLLTKFSIIEYNFEFLLFLHIPLIICYVVIFSFVFAFIVRTIEKNCLLLAIQSRKTILNLLKVVDIILTVLSGLGSSILTINFTSNKLGFAFSNLLSKTIYFEMLFTHEDLTSVYKVWQIILPACAVITFVLLLKSAIRKVNLLRTIDNTIKLGYEYEKCAFYLQTGIPYSSLNQQDGTLGEFIAFNALARSGINDIYFLFNREIPKTDGLLTEADIIVVHKKGVLVIENKHYTTRVIGNATDHDLTIIDRWGNKRSIYNPIFQNENHVRALKDYLKSKSLYIDDNTTPIRSVVAFTSASCNRCDDIISGINTSGTNTIVCTSENLSFIVQSLLSDHNPNADIQVEQVLNVLSALNVRHKIQ